MGAQIHSLRCTTAKWKIYFLMTFDVHKHVRSDSEPFLDYFHEVWHLLLALCSDVRKKICIVHIYVLGPKPLLRNFIKIFLLSIEVVRITLPPIFRLLAIFNRNFVEIVAPSSNKKNYLAILKGQSRLKKTLKTASKSTYRQRSKTCSKYIPSNEQCAGLGAWQKRHTNTTFSHLQPARVVRSPTNFSWW